MPTLKRIRVVEERPDKVRVTFQKGDDAELTVIWNPATGQKALEENVSKALLSVAKGKEADISHETTVDAALVKVKDTLFPAWWDKFAWWKDTS